MIFLDFIWLFIFMVLIDSRPMFKSIDEDYVYGKRVRDNSIHSPVYGYGNYDRKLTTQRNNKNKIESHEIDLSGFDKYITHNIHPTSKKHIFHSYYSHKNLSELLMELTTEVENLKKIYKFEDSSDSIYRDKVTENFKQPSEDNSFLDSTAEIETVLNEIKQRALKMMIQHIPSSGNIINTAVTEIMYDMGSIMHSPKMTTGYMVFKKSVTDDKNSLYNRRLRSIYHKAATIAHNLESNLQNKFVKSYEVIKNKVSANLGEELKHSENAIKEALNKLSGGKSSCKPKHSTLFKSIKTLKTTAPINRKSTVRHFTKRKFFSRKTTLTPTHTIPKVTDDFSMLSVYEKILMNAHDDNMRLLKTNTSKDHEMIKYSNLKRSVQELYEDLPDIGEEYDEENNITSKNDFGLNEPSKNETSIADDEISFNTLSNKLSYNDYVNGFKYYLNFQKDQGNENFSNLVRYQAHRHHNVDDVGKYILEKLPQLPSTRQRRFFFEQDTLEDQDLSTKSDDSWFKKHFYFFIDKDPPKKYHTFQTVSLKEDQKTTTPLSSKNLKENKTHHKIKGAAGKLLIKRNAYKTKLNTIGPTTTLFGKNSKNNGYFDVSLVHRPTAIVKLQNKGKKRKFKNIFKKMSFRKKHPKKEMARDKVNRMKRSNPFKILKDIVLRNRYTDTNNKVRKLFDYDVVTTSSNYNFVNHNNQLSKIEALLGQVPNITSKLESHDYDQYYYLPNDLNIIHNKGLYSTKERPLFISNDLPLLPGEILFLVGLNYLLN
ncbi:unnamed protein product [Pieris macdunnoughi]|uniref:Uncharacterized protein n=1 Tax=Pieris macdunnoughi TaxID=345717 RepID=A0A821MY59_9NEOP|nr:unnamed protein product [Pieris macdunnoughi]